MSLKQRKLQKMINKLIAWFVGTIDSDAINQIADLQKQL